MSNRAWTHAGISEIKDKDVSKRVRIPDKLFRDEDIAELGKPIYWHYHTEIGVVVISKEELDYYNNRDEDKDVYEMVDFNKFSEGDSEYLCTIPKKFFKGFEGTGSPKAKPEITGEIELPETGFLHFMYHDGMAEGDTKSCHVLTDTQFSERFSDSNQWNGELSKVPRFK